MAKLPKLVFVGYANIDINITPTSRMVLPGGGAYFGAIAASRLTNSVGLVTRIGYDYVPEFLLSRVLPEGVHIIADKPNARSTQTYHSETDLTDRTIEIVMGVNPDISPKDFPAEWLKTVEHVHISTMPPAQQAGFITFLQKHSPQAKISIDTDHYFFDRPEFVQEIKENFSQVDLAFANRHEYAELKEVLHSLPEAIVKFDKDGADFLEKGKKIFHVDTKEIEVKDATGAGDILAGSYLALIIEEKSREEALEQAVELATKSVKEVGVGHLFEDK